ncbi:PREDICTED: small integral membrane protein 8 isoform X2 [Miniopterus natalensis]|uniref:small integral membrane protein 8 isoform X2 n=1 Tax=Miniopterus natalensis TaxID=291302 RepID=UPI0007A6FFFE|nr:PREDICTED: small integral membrane protein 8 isoform X2 [Miniopterus natalensis]
MCYTKQTIDNHFWYISGLERKKISVVFLKSIIKKQSQRKKSHILFLGNKSLSVKMSSAPEPPAFKKEPPKEKDFPNPGLRGVRTTTLFRAVNPELFIKPLFLVQNFILFEKILPLNY